MEFVETENERQTETDDFTEEDFDDDNIDDLQWQHNLAALLLRMQTILHISESALQYSK